MTEPLQPPFASGHGAGHARVLLVDDNAAMLHQVMALLPDEFEIVETLENGDRLAAAVAALRPDVVVLDITLPGTNGIALASQLARATFCPKIVFLTVHDDSDYVRAAFEAGASGYVLKMRLSQDLLPALAAAIEGRLFVSPSGRM